MPENQKKILEMLAEKKITVEEAERLLSLTASEDGAAGAAAGESRPSIKVPYKYLRVEVRPGPESEGTPHAEKVDIRVPMNLIRAGMKLTSLIPPQAADKVTDALEEKGIKFDVRNLKPDDLEELVEALGDLQVDVKNGQETVRVFVE